MIMGKFITEDNYYTKQLDHISTIMGIKRHCIGINGEGVTSLVAFYNCPLQCKYCINPQCHSKNIELNYYDTTELIEKLAIDDLYFKATNGGVTFGGGEPLLQADLIHQFKQKCPKEWKINVETSLVVDTTKLCKLKDDIDMWIVDVKTLDKKIYKKYTQHSIDLLLKNLKYLIENIDNNKIIIRVPNIPNYTTAKTVERTITELKEMGFTNIQPFDYEIPAK